jgi:hypothetical protein
MAAEPAEANFDKMEVFGSTTPRQVRATVI